MGEKRRDTINVNVSISRERSQQQKYMNECTLEFRLDGTKINGENEASCWYPGCTSLSAIPES